MLPNILKSKGNQTMKVDQLIEYNMRNIFLEEIIHKTGGENGPSFLLNPKFTAVETKLQSTCFYLILSIFKK